MSVIRPMEGAIARVQKFEETGTRKILTKLRNVIGFLALLTTAIPVWADSTSPTSDEAALVSAAEHGKNDEIRKLLRQGVDVNGKYYDSTALTEAIVKKHIATVKLLLEAGANPNIPSVIDLPLSLAASFGVPEIATLLLEHGADPNLEYLGNSPLCALTWEARYSESAQVGIARRLLKAGASADQLCARSGGETPLRNSIENNKVAVAKVLLEAGANPNKVTDRKSSGYEDGEVPLLAAIRQALSLKDLSMTKLLLDFGADPNYRNGRMYHESEGRGNHDDLWNGTSPLIFVADSDELPIIKLLLDRGANPCLPRTDGASPYSIALQAGQKASAKLILEYAKKKSCPGSTNIAKGSSP